MMHIHTMKHLEAVDSIKGKIYDTSEIKPFEQISKIIRRCGKC